MVSSKRIAFVISLLLVSISVFADTPYQDSVVLVDSDKDYHSSPYIEKVKVNVKAVRYYKNKKVYKNDSTVYSNGSGINIYISKQEMESGAGLAHGIKISGNGGATWSEGYFYSYAHNNNDDPYHFFLDLRYVNIGDIKLKIQLYYRSFGVDYSLKTWGPFYFNYDKSAPTITLQSDVKVNEDNYTISDDFSELHDDNIYYSIDSLDLIPNYSENSDGAGEYVAGETARTTITREGETVKTFNSCDNVGNRSSKTVYPKIDRTAPEQPSIKGVYLSIPVQNSDLGDLQIKWDKVDDLPSTGLKSGIKRYNTSICPIGSSNAVDGSSKSVNYSNFDSDDNSTYTAEWDLDFINSTPSDGKINLDRGRYYNIHLNGEDNAITFPTTDGIGNLSDDYSTQIYIPNKISFDMSKSQYFTTAIENVKSKYLGELAFTDLDYFHLNGMDIDIYDITTMLANNPNTVIGDIDYSLIDPIYSDEVPFDNQNIQSDAPLDIGTNGGRLYYISDSVSPGYYYQFTIMNPYDPAHPDDPNVDNYAHEILAYRVTTIHNIHSISDHSKFATETTTPGCIQNITEDGTTENLKPPNHVPDFSMDIYKIDSNDKVSDAPLTSITSMEDFNQKIDSIENYSKIFKTNGKIRLKIKLDAGSEYDEEGDRVSFTLSQQNNENPVIYNYKDGCFTIDFEPLEYEAGTPLINYSTLLTINEDFNGDGILDCQTAMVNTLDLNQDGSDTDTIGLVLFKDSRVYQNYSINLSHIPNSADIVGYLQDWTEDNEKYSNHKVLNISVGDILYDDPSGYTQVSIFNLPVQENEPFSAYESYDSQSDLETFYEQLVDNDSGSITNYTLPAYSDNESLSANWQFNASSSQWTYNTDSITWDLNLPDDEYLYDGQFRAAFGVRIEDGAGNYYIKKQIVTYDVQAPQPPSKSDISYSHNSTDGGKALKVWVTNGSASDDYFYWDTGDGNPGNLGDGPLPEYSYDTTNIVPNTPVPVHVRAVDKAGNYSDYSDIPLYTLPAAGTAEATDSELDVNNKPVLSWTVMNEPTFSGSIITIYPDPNNDTDTVILNDQNSDPNNDYEIFTTAERPYFTLTPHGTIAYTITPYNNGGDVGEETARFFRTLKNSPPEMPKVTGPVKWSSSSINFSWSLPVKTDGDGNDEVIKDKDGDDVAYTVYMRDSGSADWIPVGDTHETHLSIKDWSGKGITPAEGKAYEWKVSAADNFQIDPSWPYLDKAQTGTGYKPVVVEIDTTDPPTFSVDDTAPDIQLPQKINTDFPFSNTNNYYFTANDSLSGIKDGSVKLKKMENGIAAGDVELTKDNDTYRAVLPDGVLDLKVSASDNAGNTATVSDEVHIDTVAPEIPGDESPVIQGADSSGVLIKGNYSIPVYIPMFDSTSGVSGFYYRFISDSGSTEKRYLSIGNNFNPDDPLGGLGNKSYSGDIIFNGNTGINYTAGITVVDMAGNESEEYETTERLFVDTTAPTVSGSITGGIINTGGVNYASNIGDLTILKTAVDAQTQIKSYEYTYYDMDTASYQVWTNNFDNLKGRVLTVGGRYRIAIKATNGAGLSAIGLTEEFKYDNSSPSGASLLYSSISGELVPGETVQVRLHSSDEESQVSVYRVAVGKTAGGTEISSLLDGNVYGFLQERMVNDGFFSFAIPQIADGAYTISVQVENGAGLNNPTTSFASIVNFTVNKNAEKIIVKDTLPYSSNNQTLYGTWEYNGTKLIQKYFYRVDCYNGDALVSSGPWQETELNEAVATYDSSSPLENGLTYRFTVKGVYSDGSESPEYHNHGVTIDTTEPVFDDSSFVVPEAATSNNLKINWHVEDAISGINRVEVIIKSYDDAGNLYEIARTDITPSGTGSDIPLLILNSGSGSVSSGQKIYVTLRITNGAGTVIDRISPAITIDDTPPPVPMVLDQGDYHNFNQDVSFSWKWSEDDPESGIEGYEWAVFKAGEDSGSLSWSTPTTDTQITALDPKLLEGVTDGEAVYFAVKSINKAGLESVGITNGIIKDSSAPNLSLVKLLDVRSGDGQDVDYINRKEDLGVLINATDNISGTAKYYTAYGMYEEGVEWIQHGDEVTGTASPVAAALGTEITDGNIIFFRGKCADDVGLVSAYGYAGGVMYDTTVPEVYDAHGLVSGDLLNFDWTVRGSLSPIKRYSVELVSVDKQTSAESLVWSGSTTGKLLALNSTDLNLSDNYYKLRVAALNMAGNWSPSAYSPVVMVDRSPAFITSIKNDRYVSKKMGLIINAGENLSSIEEYQYAVGTYENPFAVSGSWKSVVTGSGTIDDSINFADLPGGTDSVVDKSKLYVTVLVKNSASLWSQPATGESTIVDKTPAFIDSVAVDKHYLDTDIILDNAYTASKYSIDGISISGIDPESGITGYRYSVISDPAQLNDPSSLNWFTVDGVAVPGEINEYSQEKLKATSLTLNDDTKYYIALEIKNGSGDYSEASLSNVVTADFTPPSFNFKTAALEDESHRAIYNDDPITIGYTTSDKSSERVFVKLQLISPAGMPTDYDPVNIPKPYTASNGFYFKTQPGPETYGVYNLIATVIDAAGNRVDNVALKKIRVNSPPVITFPEILSTPGKPVDIKGDIWVVDNDESETEERCDYPLYYQWTWGDGTNGGVFEKDMHRYYQSSETAQESEYTLTLHVVDKYGKAADGTTTVKIENTKKGELYTDEYWSGEHQITGDILVPEGLKLTIAEASNVLITGNALDGSAFALTVNGTIEARSGTVFKMNVGPYTMWKGLKINGTADLTGLTIRDAERGLAIMKDAHTVLYHLVFEDNLIGIHLYGNSPVLDGHVFENNMKYGIKEDAGAAPSVTNCTFIGNRNDYYDENETVMDYQELNLQPGNSGNTGE